MVLFEFQGRTYSLSNSPTEAFKQITQKICLGVSQLYFICNGKLLDLNNCISLEESNVIKGLIRLRGGKGGFGAKLKTEGGKKVRPNDNMFSRDMSGRRISYTLMEKDYAEFCRKKNQQDQKVKKQREQFKLMENTLKQQHAFMKLDKAYNNYLSETEKQLQQSFKIGKDKYFEKLHKSKVQDMQLKDNQEQKRQFPEKKQFFQSKVQQKVQQNVQQKVQQKIQQKVQKKEQVTLKDEQVDNLRNAPQKKVKLETFSMAKQKLKSIFKK